MRPYCLPKWLLDGIPQRRLLLPVYAVLVVISLLLSACTASSTVPTAAPAPPTPSSGGTPIVQAIGASSLQVGDIPRDQALFIQGSESSNPRDYDPATDGHDSFVFSGLVSFDPQLNVVPDLAASWDVSAGGTVYTFHLRPNARFQNGRPVTAQDVIYSWERAAAPATASDIVLTYLGDIVGVQEMHAGKAAHISGLRAVDDHTLQVTIDAPKPYFLGKLTYTVAAVVDRANVESGPAWYRRPNGTGPYKLIRWDPGQVQIYERNDQFYLPPPSIRYIVVKLFAGVGLNLYETGDVDITGVSTYNAERLRDPTDPLHSQLVEGVTMCTSKVTFDVRQPPFDDAKVRQAFALAVDRQQYIDLALHGVGIRRMGSTHRRYQGIGRTYRGSSSIQHWLDSGWRSPAMVAPAGYRPS